MAVEAAPPKNVTIEVGPNEKWPERHYLCKYFVDPDYIYLDLSDRPKHIQFSWATELGAGDAVNALGEFIRNNDMNKGDIVLHHTFERRGTVVGGHNFLRGDAEDVIDEVYDSEERTGQFSLRNKHMHLFWGHAWPKNFHDIPINEITLRFEKAKHVSRAATLACMQTTALPGLRAVSETTLDEFAEYEPLLRTA